ncbi:MAG TPA: hypothetical protein VKU01_26260 [Bryobacteraceae bacterium]|nr:hypothetical protein [Bryobacteraceae bacterium]
MRRRLRLPDFCHGFTQGDVPPLIRAIAVEPGTGWQIISVLQAQRAAFRTSSAWAPEEP